MLIKWVNQIHANGLFQRFSNVFRGYRKRPVVCNGLKVHPGLNTTSQTEWELHLVCSQNFPKTKISHRLIRIRTCAYQGVKNVSFSENFANVLLNGRSQLKNIFIKY